MASLRIFVSFILMCCVFVVAQKETQIISAVLGYLNGNPNKIHDYSGAALIGIQTRGDISEASLEVHAVCNNKLPEIPCNDQTMVCHAYMGMDPNQLGQYQVLGDITCSPKVEIVVDEVEEPKVSGPSMVFASNGKIDLSNEAVAPEQGNPDFVAVRKQNVPCLGCPFDLDTDAEGVDELVETAVKHIESERSNRHKILNIKRLQEQIVAGIKYILLADFAETTCTKDADLSAPCILDLNKEPFICEVSFIEKPWISKSKHIIKNNCTQSQEFEPVNSKYDKDEISNDILPHVLPEQKTDKPYIPNYDSMAENGRIDEPLDPARLADLESQILLEDIVETPSSPFKAETPMNSAPPIDYLQVEPLEELHPSSSFTLDVSIPLEEHDHFMEDRGPSIRTYFNDYDSYPDLTEWFSRFDIQRKRNDLVKDFGSSEAEDDRSRREAEKNSSSSSSSSSSSEENNDQRNTHEDLDRKSKEKEDDSSSSSSSSEENQRHKRSVGQLEKISPDEKAIVRDLADFAAASLDNIDEDHHKRVILQILGAKKLKLDGIYYQIIMRLGISHCYEYEHHENCREKLFTNLTKICKVQVHVEEDYSNPKVVKSQCQNIKKDENDRNRTNYSRYKRALPGGHNKVPTTSPEVKKFVKATLQHLDSVSDGENKHKCVDILSATYQIVAGTRYIITAKIGVSECKKDDSKPPETCELLEEPFNCTIDVWSRPWLNSTLYTTTCGDKEFKFGHGPTTSQRRKRSLKVSGVLVQDLSQRAVDYINSRTKMSKEYKLIKITEAGDFNNTVLIIMTLAPCDKITFMSMTIPVCLEEPHYIDCVIRANDVFNPSKDLSMSINCSNDDEVYEYQPERPYSHKAFDEEEVFGKFCEKFGKVYANKMEWKFRFKVFQNNLNKIALLNKYEQGTGRYSITQFADLTETEFSKMHGLRQGLRRPEVKFEQAKIPQIELPTEMDWRTKGAVTEVKDQGLCGSCWAFSTTGNIEGQYAIKHGSLLEFSEQELVDCDKVDQGCNGGLMDNAYRVIEELGGLESESAYPYEGKDDTCHFSKSKVKAQLTGALNISHDETDMAKWLTQNGPISIAINANAMQFYVGGVSHPFKFLCNPNNLDHGVLIVGYGVHKYSLFNKTLPYWTVKNSWGPGWGEQGYYRVYRGDGTCGLNQTPSSAIVA
ncbi:uncharacterized protein LOC126739864 [Anthonomus grandis grandis]|uniref:uncharacterized protein LOC126739864 n=1 Tax=Anthonomus grandis grandis TaxID=2921223 RepID=UPI0021657F14|nr:uncharacterized protein LOC126739864 [Anthonomus grandis grandis]